MKLSKMEFVAILVALFVALHFYTQHQLESEIDASSGSAGAPLLLDSDNPPVIVAFGDSFTAGVGASPAKSYPAQLSRMMGLDIVNAGQAGERTSEALRRLAAVIRQYKPTIVLIQEGADDLYRGRRQKEIGRDLIQMVKLARDKGVRPILIGFPDPDLIDMMIASDVDLYPMAAERTGAAYIPDVFGPVLRKEALVSDDLTHPNAKGYRAVAEKIYQYFLENAL